jgi:hypothetical protein
MIAALILLVVAMALSPLALAVVYNAAFRRGWWGLLRKIGHVAPYIFGAEQGRAMAFQAEVFALREAGRMRDAVALVTVWLLDEDVPVNSRNTAIDVLISAGAYKAALAAAPDVAEPRNAREAAALALIQINLAEAEYNLGQWDAAEARLKPLDAACSPSPIVWAGLL